MRHNNSTNKNEIRNGIDQQENLFLSSCENGILSDVCAERRENLNRGILKQWVEQNYGEHRNRVLNYRFRIPLIRSKTNPHFIKGVENEIKNFWEKFPKTKVLVRYDWGTEETLLVQVFVIMECSSKVELNRVLDSFPIPFTESRLYDDPCIDQYEFFNWIVPSRFSLEERNWIFSFQDRKTREYLEKQISYLIP